MPGHAHDPVRERGSLSSEGGWWRATYSRNSCGHARMGGRQLMHGCMLWPQRVSHAKLSGEYLHLLGADRRRAMDAGCAVRSVLAMVYELCAPTHTTGSLACAEGV
eukprot:10530555-Alexandrium_andersonii.AAC.1